MQPAANNKPRRVEGVNINRAKKADLAKQFDEFKQRIQEFEEKNEEIISRIRQAYTFKKKPGEGRPVSIQGERRLQQLPQQSANDVQSISSNSEYSKNIVFDGNLVGAHHSNVYYDDPYLKQQQGLEVHRKSEGFAQVSQYPVQYQSYTSKRIGPHEDQRVTRYAEYMRNVQGVQRIATEYEDGGQGRGGESKQTGSFVSSEAVMELQERLREAEERVSLTDQRCLELEEEVAERDQQIIRIRGYESRFKSYSSSMKREIADQLESFQEEVVAVRMMEVEKQIKRFSNRLKNVALKLRDHTQDRKAVRTIERSRSTRRIRSQNKGQNSSISSVEKDSSVSGSRENTDVGVRDDPKVPLGRPSSSRKQKNSESLSKQKEFEQIAGEYERMIKGKVEDLERLQRQLRDEGIEKQQLAGDLRRVKVVLEEKEQQLSSLQEELAAGLSRKVAVVEQSEGRELREARERIAMLDEQLRGREQKQKELLLAIQKLQKSKKALFEEQKQSHNKVLAKKNQVLGQLQGRLRELQTAQSKELSALKQSLVVADKRGMQKDCEILSLCNKLKKLQGQMLVKEQKLLQLQGLILKESDNGDLLERSMSVDTSLFSHGDFKSMQGSLRHLEEELEEKNGVIEELQREGQRLAAELQNSREAGQRHLEETQRVREQNGRLLRNVEALEKRVKEESQSEARVGQRKESMVEEHEAERAEWTEEKEGLVGRTAALLEEVKRLRQENLGYGREIIKLNAEVSFGREEQAGLEQKLLRAKEESVQCKGKLVQAEGAFKEQEGNLILEIKRLQVEREQLVGRVGELQGKGEEGRGEERQDQNLLNSLHASEVSFILQRGRGVQEEELGALRERVRELQSGLQMRELMELQLQEQYRGNLQKLRGEVGERAKVTAGYEAEIGQLRRQLGSARQQERDDVSFENYKVALYEEKILQLENEYACCRDSEQRLNELLHELTDSMREKAEEAARLQQTAESRQRTIEELRELLEVRDGQVGKDGREGREEWKEASLRMSAGSEEASDAAELSYLSNISDVFKHDDKLQERMQRGKTSRQQFVRLFTKTSAYIKTLKRIIQGKEGRVKALEKQVLGLRRTEKGSWSESKDKERAAEQAEKGKGTERGKGNEKAVLFSRTQVQQDEDSVQQFKDYDSVQVDTRRSKSYELVKQLQREKQLVVQQNKMLVNQIELLQQQIAKGEQQQNSLVRIKDLYKEEIKKLMDKIEINNREYEMQFKRIREECERRDSYEYWEALRQVFAKMLAAVGAIEGESSAAGRQEKKKELDEYLKVMASILEVDFGSKAGKGKR